MGTKVVLNGVVIQFPHLFTPHTPKTVKTAEPAYGATFLLPPNHPQINELSAAVEAEINGKFPKGKPPRAKYCLGWADPRYVPEHMRNWVSLTARNTLSANPLRRDRIVGPDLKPIMVPGDIFSGCIVNVSVDIYGYVTGDGGVTSSIDALQLVASKDVERLDGVVQEDVGVLFRQIDGSRVGTQDGDIPFGPSGYQAPVAPVAPVSPFPPPAGYQAAPASPFPSPAPVAPAAPFTPPGYPAGYPTAQTVPAAPAAPVAPAAPAAPPGSRMPWD